MSRYRHLMGQKQMQHREAVSQKLTVGELEKVSDGTNVYKSIGARQDPGPAGDACGAHSLPPPTNPNPSPTLAPRRLAGRMFMLTEKATIISEYTAAVKKAEDRLLVMGNTQNYLERQMEECQKSLTELSMANPTGEPA